MPKATCWRQHGPVFIFFDYSNDVLLAAFSVMQRHVRAGAITGREGYSGGPRVAASISDLAACTHSGAFIVWTYREVVVNKALLNKGTNFSYTAEMYPSTVLELRA